MNLSIEPTEKVKNSTHSMNVVHISTFDNIKNCLSSTDITPETREVRICIPKSYNVWIEAENTDGESFLNSIE